MPEELPEYWRGDTLHDIVEQANLLRWLKLHFPDSEFIEALEWLREYREHPY